MGTVLTDKKLLFEDCDAVQVHADALESIVKMQGGVGIFRTVESSTCFAHKLCKIALFSRYVSSDIIKY